MSEAEVHEALRNLILGTGVRRGSHELFVDGTDATSSFRQLLLDEGFQPSVVNEIDIQPGERVPAFYIEGRIAHFGWVFWEAFFPGRMRKIFGSVNRNEQGDWAIILGRGNKQTIYVNRNLREQIDLERPSEF